MKFSDTYKSFDYTGLSCFVIKIPVTAADFGKTRSGEIKLPDAIKDLKGFVITSSGDTKGFSNVTGRLVIRFDNGIISPIHLNIPDIKHLNTFDNPYRLEETIVSGSVLQGFFEDFNYTGGARYFMKLYIYYTNHDFFKK